MNYTDKVYETFREAKEKLNNVLSNGQNVQLCELTDEEGDYTDEFYELPAQFLFGKYNYAVPYTLYEVYKEDDKIYIKGLEIEECAYYDFQPSDLEVYNLCAVVDLVIETLN